MVCVGGFFKHCARLTLRMLGVSQCIVELHVVTLAARLLSVDGKESDGAGGNKYVDVWP